jgi:Flp pilus assembly protein TadD
LAATDGNPWRVQDALGSVFEALRWPADAEREFRAAVLGNKNRSPEPRYHFGRFLIREARAAEAVEVLAPAAKQFPKNERVRFELGRSLYQLNRFEEAEKEIAAAPSLEEARRLLQKVRRQSGK